MRIIKPDNDGDRTYFKNNSEADRISSMYPGSYPLVGLGATPMEPRRDKRDQMIEWLVLQLNDCSFLVSLRCYNDNVHNYMRFQEGTLKRYKGRLYRARDFSFGDFIVICDITPACLQSVMEQIALMHWLFRYPAGDGLGPKAAYVHH